MMGVLLGLDNSYNLTLSLGTRGYRDNSLRRTSLFSETATSWGQMANQDIFPEMPMST